MERNQQMDHRLNALTNEYYTPSTLPRHHRPYHRPANRGTRTPNPRANYGQSSIPHHVNYRQSKRENRPRGRYSSWEQANAHRNQENINDLPAFDQNEIEDTLRRKATSDSDEAQNGFSEWGSDGSESGFECDQEEPKSDDSSKLCVSDEDWITTWVGNNSPRWTKDYFVPWNKDNGDDQNGDDQDWMELNELKSDQKVDKSQKQHVMTRPRFVTEEEIEDGSMSPIMKALMAFDLDFEAKMHAECPQTPLDGINTDPIFEAFVKENSGSEGKGTPNRAQITTLWCAELEAENHDGWNTYFCDESWEQ